MGILWILGSWSMLLLEYRDFHFYSDFMLGTSHCCLFLRLFSKPRKALSEIHLAPIPLVQQSELQLFLYVIPKSITTFFLKSRNYVVNCCAPFQSAAPCGTPTPFLLPSVLGGVAQLYGCGAWILAKAEVAPFRLLTRLHLCPCVWSGLTLCSMYTTKFLNKVKATATRPYFVPA